jgi:DNA-binding IclR family transcriptional regulator
MGRGLQAMALLRDSPLGELGLAELSRGIGLHKSTVHRLLATLVRHGYVLQNPVTRRYRLGLVFLEFAQRVVEQLEVRRHALRPMHQLAELTGESVYVSVLSGGRTLAIDEVVGPRGVTLGTNVGVSLPLHATASGKCFLAWLPPEARDRLLASQPLARVTERTIVDRDALMEELAQTRRRGYATNDEETEPGVRYAAAPVFDEQGAVAATLSLGAPVLRLPQAELPGIGAAVRLAAARVSAAMGYREETTAGAAAAAPSQAAS